MGRELFCKKLKERLAETNIQLVKNDVIPFVKNLADLDIWSNDYFLQLVDKIRFM